MKIRDIIQKNNLGDLYRFAIIDLKDGRFILQTISKKWEETWRESLRVETSARRLEQLANEILNYLDKKVKWQEWKPTMNELEQRLKEISNPDFAIEHWFIDWIRTAVILKRKSDVKQARRIYEWLKYNENWLYER